MIWKSSFKLKGLWDEFFKKLQYIPILTASGLSALDQCDSIWHKYFTFVVFLYAIIFCCILDFFHSFSLSNQPRAGHRPIHAWFLEIYLVREVCVCMCLPPRLVITSGVMWCDMDLIWFGWSSTTIVSIISKHGPTIGAS